MEEEDKKDKESEAQNMEEIEEEKLAKILKKVNTNWHMREKDICFDGLVCL